MYASWGAAVFCSVVSVMKIGFQSQRLFATGGKSGLNVFEMRMYIRMKMSDLGCKFRSGLSGNIVPAVLSLFARRLWPYQFAHSRRPPKQESGTGRV